MAAILAIAIMIITFMNIAILYDILKHKETNGIMHVHFKAALAMAIIIPVYFFFILIPDSVVEGEKDIYTKIINTNSGKEYDVMVTFDIIYHESYGMRGDREYASVEIVYHPQTIHWSNGGESRNSADNYGYVGDFVTFIDQNYKEYEVKVSEPNFTFKEQLSAIAFFDKVIYFVAFTTSLAIVVYYLKYGSKE